MGKEGRANLALRTVERKDKSTHPFTAHGVEKSAFLIRGIMSFEIKHISILGTYF